MFEKVLVALDFSPSSQKILDNLTQIPGIQEVVLLHVVDATRPSRRGWARGSQIENAKLLMAEKKEALENLGLTVHTTIEIIENAIIQGTVSQVILEVAETEHASLIVMGVRGINPIQELLLGSVSSSVLRRAKTNILIMHFPSAITNRKALSREPPPGKLFSKILVPTDFSRPATDAAAAVKTMPGIGQVVILHVVNRGESQQDIDDHVKEGQSRLEEIKREFESAGVGADIHVRVGDPTELILSTAEEEDVSLIAMSAFGTGWFRELLLGSTTFTVVRRAKRPVLVMKTGKDNQKKRGADPGSAAEDEK